MNPLEFMLMELKSNRLEVVLAPSRRKDRRDFDMIRVVASRNCDRYRRFCAKNLSTRKRRNPRPDPHPDIEWSHAESAQAEAHATLLRNYLAALPARSVSKKKLRQMGS